MKVFIQTRGRTTDYRFLGETPKERWWLDYSNVTSFEKPTLLVTSENQRRAYFSGISSERKDRVGTTIRYTLVLEDVKDEAEITRAKTLVAAWLEDAASPEKRHKVQDALDTEFSEKDVERLLGDHKDGAAEETGQKLREAIDSIGGPGAPLPDLKDPQPAWCGNLQKEGCREAFLHRVNELLKGQEGAALMVNLAGEAEARAILDKLPTSARLAVLLDGQVRSSESDILPLERTPPKTDANVGRNVNDSNSGAIRERMDHSGQEKSQPTNTPSGSKVNSSCRGLIYNPFFWVAIALGMITIFALFAWALDQRSAGNNTPNH
jgi:hypothetical protein